MGFRRLNFFTLLPALFGKKTRSAMSESKEKNVDGNFAGDGWQNGGTLVVDKGGKPLLQFRQEQPGDHVDPNAVLKALGVEGQVDITHAEGGSGEAGAECTDQACALPPRKADPTPVQCTDEVCAMPKKKQDEKKVECTDDVCAMPSKS